MFICRIREARDGISVKNEAVTQTLCRRMCRTRNRYQSAPASPLVAEPSVVGRLPTQSQLKFWRIHEAVA
jgi:hypothetical protein